MNFDADTMTEPVPEGLSVSFRGNEGTHLMIEGLCFHTSPGSIDTKLLRSPYNSVDLSCLFRYLAERDSSCLIRRIAIDDTPHIDHNK